MSYLRNLFSLNFRHMYWKHVLREKKCFFFPTILESFDRAEILELHLQIVKLLLMFCVDVINCKSMNQSQMGIIEKNRSQKGDGSFNWYTVVEQKTVAQAIFCPDRVCSPVRQ